ncbi:MAG: DUF2059 domain-containing protein [Deltaproteobacteria bacterium]|nr:DUF2059 domain-containing protein [Deltaproteobacteria bacterium]
MNKLMTLALALTLSLSSAMVSTTSAEAGSAKLKKIHKLLKLTGAAAMGDQIMRQMLSSFKTRLPKVPHKFWDTLISRKDIDGLIKEVAKVYEKHLPMKDVDGLIKFYSTPLGRRFVKLQPLLMRDSMVVGQKWGQRIAMRAQKKLKAKGHLK